MDIVEKARQWCLNIRRHPAPIYEAIPMVQKLIDEIESLRKQLNK